MASKPYLELSFANSFDGHTLKEVAEDLGAGGAQVDLRHRPPEGPFAFLEWLIPTVIVLWMIKPYVEEFSKETGKAHANGLHNGLPKLWSKVFGPKPEVTYTILGTAGRPEMFSHAFSVRTTRNDGGHVTLLFPPATSCGDFLVAVDRFIELMEKHYALNGTDPLTKAMGLVSYLSHRNYQALIYMNPETGKLELIDYIGSSKERKLMTHPILE